MTTRFTILFVVLLGPAVPGANAQQETSANSGLLEDDRRALNGKFIHHVPQTYVEFTFSSNSVTYLFEFSKGGRIERRVYGQADFELVEKEKKRFIVFVLTPDTKIPMYEYAYRDKWLSLRDVHAPKVEWGLEFAGRQQLTKNDLYKLWVNLGSDDAKVAFQAVQALADEFETVPYLKQRLKPRPTEKPERIHQLIQDLESKDDETRDLAIQKLEKLGELTEPHLRSVLSVKRSDTLRTHVEMLLVKLDRAKLSGERLRTLRAIELLERIGSLGAQEILQDLAKGAPAARETKEAEAALERLKKR
jgi:hypothetical protein